MLKKEGRIWLAAFCFSCCLALGCNARNWEQKANAESLAMEQLHFWSHCLQRNLEGKCSWLNHGINPGWARWAQAKSGSSASSNRSRVVGWGRAELEGSTWFYIFTSWCLSFALVSYSLFSWCWALDWMVGLWWLKKAQGFHRVFGILGEIFKGMKILSDVFWTFLNCHVLKIHNKPRYV